MSTSKYNVSSIQQRESGLIFLTALLVIITTLYSLYISQNADFFVMNIFGISEITNTTAVNKMYGIILLLSAFKLLMLFGLLTSKNIFKKTIFAFICLMVAATLGVFAFGSTCPEMIANANDNVYYCQQTALIENNSNLVIIGLLSIIAFKGYKKIEAMEETKMEAV